MLSEELGTPQLTPYELEVREKILLFHNAVINHHPVEAESIFKQLVTEFGETVIKALNYRYTIQLDPGGQCKVSLLYLAASHNMSFLLEALLAAGVAVDVGVISVENPNNIYLGTSPFNVACAKNHLAAMRLLLENNASLLKVNQAGTSCLMSVKSYDAYRIIITHATQRQCVEQLLAFKTTEHQRNAFEVLCNEGQVNIVSHLLRLPQAKKYYDPQILLRRIRLSAWQFPDQAGAFEILAENIRAEVALLPLIHTFENGNNLSAEYFHYPSQYTYLFNEPPPAEITTKEAAVKRAITQCFDLLNRPVDCVRYLKFLNDEFLRYTGHFGAINKTTYEFKAIDNYMFPIPNEHYIGLKKFSALNNFLILLFKQYGLAENTVKWVGFIPKEQTSANINKGDFFTECRIGTGAMHGKISHMLQLAILIYAIQDRAIDISYGTSEDPRSITIHDINQGLMLYKNKEGDEVWVPVRDTVYRQRISFTDPFRIHSALMYFGESLKLTALATYLIDSFCKGIRLFLAAHNHAMLQHIGIETLVEQINDLNIHEFINSSFLFKYSIFREKNKKGFNPITVNDEYAVLNKEYAPDHTFIPKRFSA